MARQPVQPEPPPHPADGPGPADARRPAAAIAATPPPQRLWQDLGWQPSSQQLAQLVELQRLLGHWNQRVNLTRLLEGDDYWIAQVFDSLWPLRSLLAQQPPAGDARSLAEAGPSAGPATLAAAGGAAAETPAVGLPLTGDPPEDIQVIDVGTGGGFPGLAVAIALPQARLTLVDSVKRKLDAVAAMAEALGLEERLTLRCERVELSGRRPQCRGRFQLALARAVAAAPVVAEYLVPLLAPEGQALLYRGQWSEADGVALQRALTPLRAELGRLERRELPAGRGLRHALWLRPRQPCPAAYPRAVGIPARQPLGQPAPARSR